MAREELPKISLAAARVNAHMTQAEVAKKLHVSNKTVANWENGTVEIPFASFSFLSQLYHMPMKYIFLPHEST